MNEWKGYVNLYRYIYDVIKKERPSLPIFASFTLHGPLTASEADQAKTIAALDEIMDRCDLVAVSFYPFIAGGTTEIEKAFQWLFDPYDKYENPVQSSKQERLWTDGNFPRQVRLFMERRKSRRTITGSFLLSHRKRIPSSLSATCTEIVTLCGKG